VQVPYTFACNNSLGNSPDTSTHVDEHQLWLGTHTLVNMYRIPSITMPQLNKTALLPAQDKRNFAKPVGKTLPLINQQLQHANFKLQYTFRDVSRASDVARTV